MVIVVLTGTRLVLDHISIFSLPANLTAAVVGNRSNRSPARCVDAVPCQMRNDDQKRETLIEWWLMVNKQAGGCVEWWRTAR